MYCRITEIKFDYTKKDEIISMLEGFRESMMALPGIQSVCTIETGEGEITSFAFMIHKKILMQHPLM